MLDTIPSRALLEARAANVRFQFIGTPSKRFYVKHVSGVDSHGPPYSEYSTYSVSSLTEAKSLVVVSRVGSTYFNSK